VSRPLRYSIFILIFIVCTIFSVHPLEAFNRVLSVPGHPFFLSLEQKKYEDGKIFRAYLRASGEMYRLYELEGLKYIDSSFSLVKGDNDGIDDLIWRIGIEDPISGNVMDMWITALSTFRKGWIFLTPRGETRWTTLPLDLKVPKNMILYFSPSTPPYKDIRQYSGKGIFTFAYTIAITENGPALVSIPEVYDELAKISRFIIANEADPRLRLVYQKICDDYDLMKEGRMPSKEAILNFSWNRILDFEWK
jgi:hypothetical protein